MKLRRCRLIVYLWTKGPFKRLPYSQMLFLCTYNVSVLAKHEDRLVRTIPQAYRVPALPLYLDYRRGIEDDHRKTLNVLYCRRRLSLRRAVSSQRNPDLMVPELNYL
jgi:hypothetical protein